MFDPVEHGGFVVVSVDVSLSDEFEISIIILDYVAEFIGKLIGLGEFVEGFSEELVLR